MVDTMVGTMVSKGNLAKEHQKAHSCLQSKIHLDLLLEVLYHLGVHLHSRVCLPLEVHHFLPKVHSHLLVVFHSHEKDYHHFP
jgi:hypothetical protein